MRLTFQSERWRDLADELRPLLFSQWEELALDRDTIPLDPDWDRYRDLDEKGALDFTTVRDAGRLVGWYVNVVAPHPHYKSTLFGFLDLYYVLPEYRKARVGLGLFAAMEKAMRNRGIKEVISITKSHLNVAPLFDRLGWRETGITYTKVLR